MENEILLTLLAKCDATFWPTRDFSIPGVALFYERRRDFLTHGLPWASKGGTDERARKEGQRALDALAKDGKVQTYGGKSRTRGARLTEEADDRLRRSIGLLDFNGSLGMLDRLYALRDDGDGFDGLGNGRGVFPNWTSEQTMTNVPWGDNVRRGFFALMTEDLFPLLWRGLARSGSDMLGHVWYCLTATGFDLAQQRAQDGVATGDYPPPLPDGGDEAAHDFYHDVRREEVDTISNGKPAQRSEIGNLPLSCSPILRKYLKPEAAPAQQEKASTT